MCRLRDHESPIDDQVCVSDDQRCGVRDHRHRICDHVRRFDDHKGRIDAQQIAFAALVRGSSRHRNCSKHQLRDTRRARRRAVTHASKSTSTHHRAAGTQGKTVDVRVGGERGGKERRGPDARTKAHGLSPWHWTPATRDRARRPATEVVYQLPRPVAFSATLSSGAISKKSPKSRKMKVHCDIRSEGARSSCPFVRGCGPRRSD